MLRHQWVLKRLAVSVLAVTLVLVALYSDGDSSSSRTPPSPPPPVSSDSNGQYVSSSSDGQEANNVTRPSTTTTTTPSSSSVVVINQHRRRRFAVFSCATPDEKWNGTSNQQRQYDYAFYLPLTVLAWRRIGYESLVLIVGHRREWLYNPVLAHVLDTLETLAAATVLFLPANVENRVMLSQTARIFTANLDGYPGRPSDFILTSDSDLWPLRKRHFYQQPEGAEERPLMLFHSDCCRPFVFKGRSYKMQPMSHVGASAATWQEMVNQQPQQQPQPFQQQSGGGTNSSSSVEVRLPAKDSDSILDRLAETFGQQVRRRVQYASGDWFVDQKFITLSIDRWLNRRQQQQQQQQQQQTNKSSPSMANNQIVYKVSDVGLRRLDRFNWNVNIKKLKASSSNLLMDASYYDAHLPMGGFQPSKWNSIRPLLRLMYGGRAGKAAASSSTYRFCDSYATTFRRLFMNSSTTRS